MTVEVFKTNVNDSDQARMLVHRIHAAFRNYTANFDLEDCDRILRIETRDTGIEVAALIALLRHLGFDAEVLPDDMPEVLEI